MQYRLDKATGNELSVLGLGCMRFSRDKAETERMILTAIEKGMNFFDTAYIYPGSEKTLGEVLSKNNKREDVYIATKLPLVLCKSGADFDKYFNEQLRRLKTDYIDYYFLHNLTDLAHFESFCEMGIKEWLAEKMKAGQIRQVGFSYHGSGDEFPKVLDAYNWGFCMIQYNYYDENYQAGKKGLKAAAERGVSVMIMEPLLGGRLATGLPKQAAQMFKKANPELTPADWAFWWLYNQREVTVVLSGMNSLRQIESNINAADNFRPLTEKEPAVYADVVELFRKSYKINCTSCNYCLPCPKGINIPACFSAYNAAYTQGFITSRAMYFTSTGITKKNPSSPRLCNDCGKCEKVCPQNLPIRNWLKKVSGRMEPLPIRMVLALVRKILAG